MSNFKTQAIGDLLGNSFSVPNLTAKTIDCDIHGKDVKATFTGRCTICFEKKCTEDYKKDMSKFDPERAMKAKKSCGLIGEEILNANFDNYFPDCKDASLFLAACKQYNFKSNLLFLGNTGTGKTHMSSALIEEAWKQDLSAYYVEFYNLGSIKFNNITFFNKMINCDFLVIDEYGHAENATKSTVLFEIIDQRCRRGVYTLIISNLDADNFRDTLSQPVFSRLKQNVQIHLCGWEDYRVKHAK